jgi:hypothetical protein
VILTPADAGADPQIPIAYIRALHIPQEDMLAVLAFETGSSPDDIEASTNEATLRNGLATAVAPFDQPYRRAFTRRIAATRIAAGLTQRELATRLPASSLHHRQLTQPALVRVLTNVAVVGRTDTGWQLRAAA